MKWFRVLALSSALCLGGFSGFCDVMAQENNADEIQASGAKSGKQRIESNKIRRNNPFTHFGQTYTDFKNMLSRRYNLDYSVDVSYMPQYGAPSGKKAAIQTAIYPSVTWTAFNNENGNLSFNAAYSIVRYSGTQAQTLQNRIGVATDINDYDSPSNTFDELYLSYQLPGKANWLTVALGQFPIYNFDGTTYDANQQVNFINYALSQNASSSYPSASLGGYMQISPNPEWNFAFGAQDATNIDGYSISTAHLGEEHYTTFASLSYTPTIGKLGDGQYSILLYNQPGVEEQPQTTNGWSLNLSQDFGDVLSVFARANGVSGDMIDIDQSYVLGMVLNNPFDRNPLDQIGFAGAYNKINETAVGENLANSAEKVLEAYWSFGVSKWMIITPDIQFYFDPAENPKSDYATVFTLRSTIFF